MQNLVTSALLLPFETLINQCIAQDIQLSRELAALDGKVLEIEITRPRLGIFLMFYQSSVRLSFSNPLSRSESHADKAVTDGKIQGTASTLLELMVNRRASNGLVQPGIQISGDSDFIQEVHRLFSAMEIDWQEPLARVVGDVPTHALDQLIQKLSDFARNSSQAIKTNIDEYLHEESKIVPPLNQVEIFDRDLDNLRLRLDRLQARQRILADRLKQEGQGN